MGQIAVRSIEVKVTTPSGQVGWKGAEGAWSIGGLSGADPVHEATDGSQLLTRISEIEASGDPSSLVSKTISQLGPMVVHDAALRAILDQPGDNIADMTRTLQICPTLSARLVSIINSPTLGVCWREVCIQRVVQEMGRRARAIALAYALRCKARASHAPPEMIQRYHEASIRKACAARLFCEELKPTIVDTAYVLGLIADIGLPMLMSADSGFYRAWFDDGEPQNLTECERNRFGLHHGSVGQELLMSWNAGEVLQQCVLNHHQAPSQRTVQRDVTLKHALRFAAQFPHLSRTIGRHQLSTMRDLHERFLSSGRYSSLELFLKAVEGESRAVRTDPALPQSVDAQSTMASLVCAATGATIHNTIRLCKMERTFRGQRANLDMLREQAFTDSLTQLHNRRGFTELADQLLTNPQNCGRGVCCMIFDLDGLKPLNDTHGHEAGDMLLRGFARLLRRFLDKDDLVARFGGDEFAALVRDVDKDLARKVATRIINQLHLCRLKTARDIELTISCSAGAVHYNRETDGPIDIEDLIVQADRLMYSRKHQGKRGMVFGAFKRQQSLDPAATQYAAQSPYRR